MHTSPLQSTALLLLRCHLYPLLTGHLAISC